MVDGAKKRRNYLLKYGATIPIRLASGCAATLLGLYGLIGLLSNFLIGRREALTASDADFARPVLYLAAAALALWICSFSVRKAAIMPYVQPLSKQIASLPAAEVLLRSSDQPAVAPDELLRAARPGAETDAEELIRPVSRGVTDGE